MNIENLLAGLKIHERYSGKVYAEFHQIWAGNEYCTPAEKKILVALGWTWDNILNRWQAFV